jgi:hypothetical protein
MAYSEDREKRKKDIKEWPEEIQQSLIKLLTHAEKEDEYIRQRMLRECKQNELYWHGFQYIFWDERVQDFRIPTQDVMEQVSSREEVKFIYDYVVNIFKAHGLSIIAALSAEIPGVPFSPADADNIEDTLAARKAEELGKVIQKTNKSKLIFYHALFTLYTNYFVAAYNCYERDEKLGTIEMPKYEKQMTKVSDDSYTCPEAGCKNFSSPEELQECPHCGGPLDYNEGEEANLPVKVGVETIEKGMERIKVKGTLNVKISTYAADQDGCGYLIDYVDTHFAWLRNNYPNVERDKISIQASDNFERVARMPSIGRLYSDTYLQDLLTLKRVWLRPWMYDILEEDECDVLHKEFPKGVYFAVIDSGAAVFAEARQEKLDDHWTITKGDLSRSVHGDPLGKPLMPMQDLENMVTNLLTESLEHSVPTTWADPEILDFETFSKQEVSPGSVYPAKTSLTNPNRRMEDYFFTLKTSTLPKEGVDFDKIIETKGQFLVGAFPSIFGGPQTQGSKTLGEYQESRGYALQRLSIPYQLLFFWWADVIHKSVKDYISNMVSDEKHTVQGANGNYESIAFLQETFQKGRFNQLLPESAVDLPVSFSQKRSTIQGMVQLNSDILNQFLFSPENRKVTLKFLGIEELSDMESNQVMKQLFEIEQLLREEPIQDETTGQETSSIPIEPEVDDSEVHLRVIKNFASSPCGWEHKKNNPTGYKNVLLHGQLHKTQLQQEQMQQLMMQGGGKQPAPAEQEQEEQPV